ncbi:MAG: hypothetical protein FWG45_06875 [Oscillospiraceae bacterium]|nr:hypothetical protein [Oscillospiraceae bacterium]
MNALKSKPTSFDDLIGVEYTGFKGLSAIDKLLEEKQGHVKEAFYRDDVGWIDIFWGDKTAGLCHVVSKRDKKFARSVSAILENGVSFKNDSPNKLNIAYKGRLAVITFDLRGTETTALLTAYFTQKQKRLKSW